VLVVDAGNALWSQQPLSMQTAGKIIIDGMNLIAYDAMAIGDRDLELGPDVLQQRIADASFPILSANVRLTGADKLLTEPYTVLPLGDHKVGIIGLTWDGAPVSADQFTILKADQVLAQYASELAEQVDIIMVLSTMGFEEDQRLSTTVPGIDLILGGRSRIPMPESWQNPDTGTLVVQAGAQGEWVGRRILHLDSAGAVVKYEDELLFLTDEYPDDPEMRTFLDNYSVE
jgi:2',3'-cyclic-nucleotide 2'-phosphodiesterase (5'-nucleotidase family)